MIKKIFSIMLVMLTALMCVMFVSCKSQEPKSYTVEFNTVEGSVVESQEVVKDGRVQKPEDPTKEGYVFLYWYLDDSNVEFDFENYQVKSDITLTANWQEILIFTVTFDTVDGGVIEDQTIVKYSQVQKPENPIKEEYIFRYWYLDDPNVEFDFENYQVKSDITLTALWEAEEKYTVTFDSAGGTPVASQIIYKYDYVQAPQDPTKEGDTFLYWYLDYKTVNFDFENYIIESDVTLTARYESDVVKYTVTFDSVGGTPVASQEVEDYKLVQKPQDPTKEGDTFLYWYLDQQNKVFDFETRPDGNITLTARWESDVTLYTIYYKIGDELYQKQDIGRDGYYATKPVNPTKSGSTFVYWCLEGTKEPFDFSSTEITKSITLNAHFVLGELQDGQIRFVYGILAGNTFVSGIVNVFSIRRTFSVSLNQSHSVHC